MRTKHTAVLLLYGGVFMWSNGDKGARTPDLYAASVALSQLSYAPETFQQRRL